MTAEELAAIRERSVNGSADWDDPVSDARTLLDEVDHLATELTAERAKVERVRDEIEAYAKMPKARDWHIIRQIRAALDGPA